jgi:hypothetical protein
MPSDFTYMTNAKNLKAILERIRGAGTPPKFTHDFLKTLGFASSSDRPVIAVLKQLGFLSTDGVPTGRYNTYRDAARSGQAVAEGLREGWADLFLVDQSAHTRNSSQLTEAIKSVTGKGEASAVKMATTFKALSDLADWTESPTAAKVPIVEESASPAPDSPRPLTEPFPIPRPTAMNLHHDVHIHLPSTSDLSVYTAIFRALKAELL